MEGTVSQPCLPSVGRGTVNCWIIQIVRFVGKVGIHWKKAWLATYSPHKNKWKREIVHYWLGYLWITSQKAKTCSVSTILSNRQLFRSIELTDGSETRRNGRRKEWRPGSHVFFVHHLAARSKEIWRKGHLHDGSAPRLADSKLTCVSSVSTQVATTRQLAVLLTLSIDGRQMKCRKKKQKIMKTWNLSDLNWNDAENNHSIGYGVDNDASRCGFSAALLSRPYSRPEFIDLPAAAAAAAAAEAAALVLVLVVGTTEKAAATQAALLKAAISSTEPTNTFEASLSFGWRSLVLVVLDRGRKRRKDFLDLLRGSRVCRWQPAIGCAVKCSDEKSVDLRSAKEKHVLHKWQVVKINKCERRWRQGTADSSKAKQV